MQFSRGNLGEGQHQVGTKLLRKILLLASE